MRGSSSCPATAARTVSMCWTRSNVSPSRSMYSSSTPSVYGSLEPNAWSRTLPPAGKPDPLPVIEGGISASVMPGRYLRSLQEESAGRRSLGQDRVCLDLDEPAWVDESGHDDVRVGRPDRAEHFAVRAGDLLEDVGARCVDPGPDDVLGPSACLREC